MNKKQDKKANVVNKLIERDRKSRERSTQILDYYKSGNKRK